MHKGYVMLARQIVDSEIFTKPAAWLKIFLYLLIQAQFEPYRTLKRGQCHARYSDISEACGVTRHEIDHAIRFMKKAQMLATTKATRGMIVTICNYETYQCAALYESDTKSEVKATQKRHDKVRRKELKKYTYGDLKLIEIPEPRKTNG